MAWRRSRSWQSSMPAVQAAFSFRRFAAWHRSKHLSGRPEVECSPGAADVGSEAEADKALADGSLMAKCLPACNSDARIRLSQASYTVAIRPKRSNGREFPVLRVSHAVAPLYAVRMPRLQAMSACEAGNLPSCSSACELWDHAREQAW